MITDVDECEKTASVCGANSTCNNTYGGFTCGCEDGFEMVGGSCLGEYYIVTQMIDGFEMVEGSCLGGYNTVTQIVDGCEAGFVLVTGSCLGKWDFWFFC